MLEQSRNLWPIWLVLVGLVLLGDWVAGGTARVGAAAPAVACGLFGFAPAANFMADTAPSAVAVGDFNRDGNPDLATANASSNNVSVLLGNGAGGFGTPTNFSLGSGVDPRSIAVGDFNRDSNLDLAAANYNNDNPSNVAILLGNGAGSFGAAANFAVGTGPFAVAVGDFNRDGNPDLATANDGSNNVSLLLGNGAGSFGAASNFAVIANPRSVVVGNRRPPYSSAASGTLLKGTG